MKCMYQFSAFVCVLLLALRVVSENVGGFEIPYRKTVLDNGLTVIVHEDHKAPIVAVNVWYHVGSKNERQGRTGFAHLFEHLMFNGSVNYNDDWFKAMERVGATGMNGTTSEDRTNYFQEVPRDALDFALWMESDRMGHLLGALTQARLDEQRNVVLNEKRQGENQPYAVAWRLITKNTWPAGHPYAWEVIGSEADIQAATLGDARTWFTDFYGTANAVLVVAGDVQTDEVIQKVKQYFGDITAGPPISRNAVFVAKRSGTRRMQVQDRVAQARLYKVWNIPQFGTLDGTLLSMAAAVLSDGKASRLYKRLVMEEPLVTDVYAAANLQEIAGQFFIVATVREGVEMAVVERVIDQELSQFLEKGPTSAELRRIKVGVEAEFIRGCERVGGFGGKSDVLAHHLVLTGAPDYYKTILRETREATCRQVRQAAQAWLSDGQFVLSLDPFPIYHVATNGVDRSTVPVPILKTTTQFPEIRRATLANGLALVCVERHEVPIVQMKLIVSTGYAADEAGNKGTATLVAEMLDEGTQRKSALEISTALEEIGAQLSTSCTADATSISLNTLKSHLAKALDIYAEVILRPDFPEVDFRRLQAHRLAAIRREKQEPVSVAMRILPQMIYGQGHAYGVPFSGSGYEADVARLTRKDLVRFYETWFKPSRATLVVAGDVTLKNMVIEMERRFGAWRGAALPMQGVKTVTARNKSMVYLIDRPNAKQAVIVVGGIAPPKTFETEAAIEVMNTILGGSFTSRVNLNLREDKHWSYGVRTLLRDVPGPRTFLCVAPVQADKTVEALVELQREFRGLCGNTPPTQAERDKTVTDLTLRLAGQWETLGAVINVLETLTRYTLPESYIRNYADTLRAVTLPEVSHAASEVVRPDSFIWLVVGDRTLLEPALKAGGQGSVIVVDVDGMPVK